MRFEERLSRFEHLGSELPLPEVRQDAYAQSRDDTVRCWKCGFRSVILPTGFLVGEDIPFDNLRDQTRYGRRARSSACATRRRISFFTDTDVRVDGRVRYARPR